ncbi:MAG: dTDP-4-dehydrorhamnose 3,5-epimerase [Alphaproteobacteria bacterium]|nr:dTDP-4-dehydrorhamnose 3,5-epimerase [Alphaproteobacteria bacterium]
MIFRETALEGAYVIELERYSDERGHFARAWCRDEFARRGLCAEFVQSNVSVNPFRGTLRGMHFQIPPHGEVKMVRCVRGAVFDVAVDLRPGSPSWGKWFGVELTPQSGLMSYIPAGFGHGFQTLVDDCEVDYLVSAFYEPKASSGVRHDDPVLGIEWPLQVTRISERDRTWPLLAPALSASPAPA